MLPPQSLNDLKRIIHHNSRQPFPYPYPYPLSSSSTNFSLDSPSPSIRPRSPYISSRQLQPASSLPLSSADADLKSFSHSIASQTIEGVLAPGDIVGDGFLLQGESIRLVSNGATTHGHRVPAQEFEVIKQLGSGSYAVVYLVQEVLSRPPPSEDGHMSTIGLMEIDTNKSPSVPHIVYGRKYAIKCLSKDKDALALQMDEVIIHQSLPLHPNIVTLHRTLETSAFLLLLLEYVPGEDLFYFLEQARDHHDFNISQPTDSSVNTPPTPSLLSNLHPFQLLSPTRLRLVSSMFSQMCDAVAACHAQQVFHRDIKPENFIVTDGSWTTSDGRSERKVIVKLTDFGLSTTDLDSADVDCGSAPYMSYECRNNVAPTYRPRAADVWSLGIVLINMLYHINPWTDTAQGACSSFDLYLRDPINFFIQRFMGMTRPVAETLATKIFCILGEDDSRRMSAAEFGAWAKNLPTLLGGHGIQRTVSSGSTQGHRISLSIRLSHLPSSRHPSGCTAAARTPLIPTRSLSRAPSLEPAFEREELSTVLDHDNEGNADGADVDMEIVNVTFRSTSANKRRKRGRKGKGISTATLHQVDTLETLAVASQSLAREISMTSRSSSHQAATSLSRTGVPYESPLMQAVPVALLRNAHPSAPLAVSMPAPAPAPSPSVTSTLPPVTKKPPKWKLGFGKNSTSMLANATNAAATAVRISPVEEVSAPASLDPTPSQAMVTASNVSSLLMGLDAPPPSLSPSPSRADFDASSPWGRGRQRRRDLGSPASANQLSRSPGYSPPNVPRAISPNSTRSGRLVGSSASSVVSSNWRSSMSTSSSAGYSTSQFTRYNNSSTSVSTAATSGSSASWRTKASSTHSSSSSTGFYANGNVPRNIKIMDSIPWELDELPRGQHPNPNGDIFGSSPVRKQRTRKPPKDLKLDTITERPSGPASNQKSPPEHLRDATTSTTDLGGGAPNNGKDDGEGVKKVQKGQINALAKMLSALRR